MKLGAGLLAVAVWSSSLPAPINRSGLLDRGFDSIDDLLAHSAHLVEGWNNWLSSQGINIPEPEGCFNDAWASDLDV